MGRALDAGGGHLRLRDMGRGSDEDRMMGGGYDTSSEVTASEAQQIANEWLAERNDGLTADAAEAFPGYYTLHTLKEGQVEGMLSVSSTAEDVWHHSWHGDFIKTSEGS